MDTPAPARGATGEVRPSSDPHEAPTAPARPRPGARHGWLRPHASELPDDPDAPAAGLTVGVLALQGAFAEHAHALRRLGADVREVRTPAQLAAVDALCMPGGESTTMSKLLVTSGCFDALAARLAGGFPVFGTCAGLILLASHVLDGRPDQRSFAALDVTVRRNGYGRQVDSFEADLAVEALNGVAADGRAAFRAVFIRAPLVEALGPEVEVLATVDTAPVLVRQGSVLASSFHPELTADTRIHRLFVDTVVRPALRARG